MKNKNEDALDVLATYYYPRAKYLQTNCNWGTMPYTNSEADRHVNDPLMQNIEIYDCYTRNAAGFSNVLQDLMLKTNTPKKHHQDPSRTNLISKYKTELWDLDVWIWVMLVHRMTGSGASFQDDHGYRNNIVQYFGMCEDIPSMISIMRAWKEDNKPMFTSIGNQPAAPKHKSNMMFMIEDGVEIAKDLATKLESSGDKMNHKDLTDYLNKYNIDNGHRRFNFQYAAMSFDISDYFPDLVDADSHAYFGNNAKRCAKLLMPGYSEDEVMDTLRDLTGGKPKDLEDVLCDFCRFMEDYDPWQRGQFFQKSGLYQTTIFKDRSGANRW